MDRPLAGRSILVVEDEPVIALDIVMAFEKAGAQVTTTTPSDMPRSWLRTMAYLPRIVGTLTPIVTGNEMAQARGYGA